MNNKKVKRNRAIIEKVGMALFGAGILWMGFLAGESTIPLGKLAIWCLVACGVTGVGTLLVNFVDKLEEKYPIE